MTGPSWVIRDIDLSDGPCEVAASDRPHFLVFWWRALPLGCRALLPAELPFRREQMVALATELIADQAEARPARFEDLHRAGVDGHPTIVRRLGEALTAPSLIERIEQAATPAAIPTAKVSVVVCSRDRPAMLQACLESLGAQLSPPHEVVVVDNSSEGGARAACADLAGVTYVHEPRPGLSIARNSGVAAASGELVAFTDDDVELPADWTQEIVRAFEAPRVDAVTGLVLPASLETSAQRAFQLELGGFGSRFTPIVFDRGFLEQTLAMGPQVWRIGAGANMAFRKAVMARVGGFDERLGAGASGCSEDSEYWYRILAAGGVCLYEPRLVVRHHHRADWAGLRRQMRAYMKGHVSALVVQADRFGDQGNIRRIFRQLPAYFARVTLQSVQNSAWWRLRLLAEEILGWCLGLTYLVRPMWRARGQAADGRGPAVLNGHPVVSHA